MAKAFLERYRFNPQAILEYLGLKEDEEPYIIPDPGVNEVIVKIEEKSDMSSLPALTEEEEEEKEQVKSPPSPKKKKSQSRHHHQAISSPPPLKKNMLAPW